jgi:hypothetical protein
MVGYWGHDVQVDDFKPEAGDPQYEPGQGGLIGQLGAKGRRGPAYGDRAVIEFRVQRGTRLPGESDLICLGSHQGYALQPAGSFVLPACLAAGPASPPFGGLSGSRLLGQRSCRPKMEVAGSDRHLE